MEAVPVRLGYAEGQLARLNREISELIRMERSMKDHWEDFVDGMVQFSRTYSVFELQHNLMCINSDWSVRINSDCIASVQTTLMIFFGLRDMGNLVDYIMRVHGSRNALQSKIANLQIQCDRYQGLYDQVLAVYLKKRNELEALRRYVFLSV